MELRKLNVLIGNIKKGATKQRADIQTALVECAVFVFRDRNLDPAIRLLDAIGKGVNRRGVGKWLSANAPVHFKDEKPLISEKAWKALTSTTDETEFRTALESVAPWYDMDESNKAVNVWDAAVEMARVEKYLADEIKKARTNKDEVFAEYMDKVLLAAKDTFIRARAECVVSEAAE